MDTDGPSHPRPSTSKGGTVEPLASAKSADRAFQGMHMAGQRYEMRDPTTDVTHRSASLQEITAKADQIGSSRFVIVDPSGTRSQVLKIGKEWRLQDDPSPSRSESRPPAQPRPGLSVVPTTDAPARTESEQGKPPRADLKAERAAATARVEAALLERYVIKRAPVTLGNVTLGQTEYRFRGDSSRVAFTETTFRLATDTNSPSVARSMVDVAEARNWRALRVSGNEDFKRMVWLEASVRGVKAVGYEPNPADLEALRKEREARLVNRIEPVRVEAGTATGATADKPAARGGGGRKAVLAAIEAVLVAKRVPQKQREAVMAAATEKLAQRVQEGRVPRVKVYDSSAPSQRPALPRTPEVQRTQERAAPVR